MEGTEENHDSGAIALPAAAAVTSQEENLSGSTATPPGPQLLAGQMGVVTLGTDGFKKKKGRPRKYGPDGKPAVALSPMPLSASIPITGDCSGWKPSRGKSVSSIKKKQRLDFVNPGERVAYFVGANFTPHVITVNVGEDVNMKIISFAQQGSRAICILTANGAISNVTLRQPNSCGGTLTYEGRFELLSLSGAFMPNESGGAKGRSGGMSVSLAGPDGRVLGGGLAGMLVAAGPVQVVVGSFLLGCQQEQQKHQKSRFEQFATISPPPPIFPEATTRANGDEPDLNFSPTNSIHEATNIDTEKNGSLNGSEPIEPHTSQSQLSC
ncbi:AT-hook motif nuclear-localized protein 3-like [Cynara cardunculus var. scolymus]|uniref:AT-hook motif nuclear-localized protein 3-like n=1 Tax=Cynara cardunculus var. scolymus TaxID=59895 RepID=UPI000D62E8D7|nr:AT-hook motif nuclear-localized protein 3-like [Cynara cardunculus var. scolymus]